MRLLSLFVICLMASQSIAQLPIRNYIGETEENIGKALDELGLYYEIQYDPESEYYDGEQMIMVWTDEYSAYVGSSIWIYLRDDACYQLQYNFFGDKFVLGSIRSVIERKKNFFPCSDLADCWSQELDGDQTSYYWNLFNSYQGDDGWQALIIEDQEMYEENRYQYEWSKY